MRTLKLGDGLENTARTSSNIWFDMAGDGYRHRTAWAGAGDGVPQALSWHDQCALLWCGAGALPNLLLEAEELATCNSAERVGPSSV